MSRTRPTRRAGTSVNWPIPRDAETIGRLRSARARGWVIEDEGDLHIFKPTQTRAEAPAHTVPVSHYPAQIDHALTYIDGYEQAARDHSTIDRDAIREAARLIGAEIGETR